MSFRSHFCNRLQALGFTGTVFAWCIPVLEVGFWGLLERTADLKLFVGAQWG
jgi:hypothetical protein